MLLSNCEQSIHIDLPKHDPELVVYSILVEDSIPIVYLTETSDFFQYSDSRDRYGFVRDALVTISVDGFDYDLQQDTVDLFETFIGYSEG